MSSEQVAMLDQEQQRADSIIRRKGDNIFSVGGKARQASGPLNITFVGSERSAQNPLLRRFIRSQRGIVQVDFTDIYEYMRSGDFIGDPFECLPVSCLSCGVPAVRSSCVGLGSSEFPFCTDRSNQLETQTSGRPRSERSVAFAVH